MKGWGSQEEKEKRRREALAEHARLHRLFLEDRLAFERERARAIAGVIESAPEHLWEGLRKQQAKWDERMRNAGSGHNRFVLAQTFFWDHFHRKWLPAVRQFEESLNEGVRKKGLQPVKKEG